MGADSEQSVDSTAWWQIVLGGGSDDLTDADADAGEQYLVLPRRSRPRMVVDRESTAGLTDFLRRAAVQRRLPATLGSVVAATGLVRRVAPTWSVVADPGSQTLRQHLGEIVGSDVRLSIVVGPPRVNRKPVVRCYRDDEVVAIAKLGPDPHTADMVDNEAEWLNRLEIDPIDGLRTPRLIHRGRFGGSAVLVMTVLPVTSDAGVAFDRMPVELLDRFNTRYRSRRTIVESSWFESLVDRFASAADDVLVAAHAYLGRDDVELDLAGWHGDWSPWNLGQTQTGEWCLWDWERAGVDVPRGFDAVHRHVQYGSGLSGARAELREMGLAAPQVDRTVGLYLLELAARTVEAGSWSTDEANVVRTELATSFTGSEAPTGETA